LSRAFVKIALLPIYLLILFSAPVLADENKGSNTLGIISQSLNLHELSKDSDPIYVEFSISGDLPAELAVDVVDILVSEQGARQILPLNSTPNSPSDYVSVSSNTQKYVPDGSVQIIRVEVEVKNPDSINKILYGGVRLTTTTTRNSESETNFSVPIDLSAVSTFTYLPENFIVQEQKTNIEFSQFYIRQIEANFLERLIPDIPRILNGSPAFMGMRFKNTGNIFLNIEYEISIEEFSYLDRTRQRELLLERQLNTRLLLPGQVIDYSTEVKESIGQAGRAIDPLSWGIFKVDISYTGKINQAAEVEDALTKYFIVFPWKYIAMLLLVLILRFIYLRRLAAKNSVVGVQNLPIIDPQIEAYVSQSFKPDVSSPVKRKKLAPKKKAAAKKKTAPKKKVPTKKKASAKSTTSIKPRKKLPAKKKPAKKPAKKPVKKKSVKR
jgi:hypothetical protein